MRSIWFYCPSGQVQERRIAKGEALHFYEQAIELYSKPAESASLPTGWLHPVPGASSGTPSNPDGVARHQIIPENGERSLSWARVPRSA